MNLPPVYLLAGDPGGRTSSYSPVLKEIYQLTRKNKPSIAYIGSASGDNPVFFAMVKGLLKKSGSGEVTLAPTVKKRPDLARARGVIESSDIVFVTGGDVEKGMNVLEEKDMIGLLKKKRDGGAPFFGISAGAIMLCRQWVRWRDPDDDSSAELFDCLGFASAWCDTHGEQEGWTELKILVKLLDIKATGYGIRAGAAIKVFSDGAVDVVTGEIDKCFFT